MTSRRTKVKRNFAEEVIARTEHDLFAFAKFVNPFYLYGDVHQEVFSWLGDPNANERQLLLLPRGHLKSHIIAVYCAWKITFNPWITIVYLASQEDLAKAQLYAIKQMMTSDAYLAVWPEMFSEESGVKGERGTWSAFAFDVDHPDRRDRGIRDHTMQIKTVKSNAMGLHCDGLVYDDVVVPSFADTAVGRSELSRSLGYFNSILNPGGWIKAVGTRYHPEDAYQHMIDEKYGVWDESLGDFTEELPLWATFERVVEDSPDRSGTGNFLWPRTQSPHNDSAYGFDAPVLSKIKSGYSSQGLTNFFAQYYNDPNTTGTDRINRDVFQYYDQRHVKIDGRRVRYKDQNLSVYAAMDVAWSESDTADYTAISVIGINADGFIYVLDLDRFKTSDFQTYYERIVSLQDKWGFKRMLVETNAGGHLVANEIEKFVRQHGGSLIVERRSVTRHLGGKEDRWATVLEPKYISKSVFHRRGGLTSVLEDELVSARPRHDDLKDSLCSAMSIAKPPVQKRYINSSRPTSNVVVGRFGGRARSR